MNNYALMIISVALTYVATYFAKKTDLNSIEDPPLVSYAILIISTVMLFPVYRTNPLLAVVNALSIGIFSTLVNFVYIIYNAPVLGAYDLVFLYLEGFSLPPIPIGSFYLPSMLVHTVISITIALYQLKGKKKDFVRFFEIHEGVARYLLFIYGLVLTLLYVSTLL